MKKIISLYGLPACGKTTQAVKISEKYGLYQFGMGEKVRAEIKADTELGKKIKNINDQGLLIPDELIVELLKEVSDLATSSGIVFDGFPRLADQAKILDDILATVGAEISYFYYLNISPEEAIQRIDARAAVEGRADDKDKNVVKNRMDVFRKESTALIAYYREQGKLKEIDGEKTIEEVFTEIENDLK